MTIKIKFTGFFLAENNLSQNEIYLSVRHGSRALPHKHIKVAQTHVSQTDIFNFVNKNFRQTKIRRPKADGFLITHSVILLEVSARLTGGRIVSEMVGAAYGQLITNCRHRRSNRHGHHHRDRHDRRLRNRSAALADGLCQP